MKMNHKMSQTIATITKEKETLLHINKNLTATTNKTQHKPNINPIGCMGITSGMDTPAKYVHPVHLNTRRMQAKPISWVGAKPINQK